MFKLFVIPNRYSISDMRVNQCIIKWSNKMTLNYITSGYVFCTCLSCQTTLGHKSIIFCHRDTNVFAVHY